MKTLAFFLGVWASAMVQLKLSAQTYSIDWYKVAGGGGASTNGAFSVTGTIGQPDASGAMQGAGYSLTGGFWSLVDVVQAPGLPKLTIVRNGNNSVQVLWQDPATNTYTLQQNSTLAADGWMTSSYSVTNSSGTNAITIKPFSGNSFFRLKQ